MDGVAVVEDPVDEVVVTEPAVVAVVAVVTTDDVGVPFFAHAFPSVVKKTGTVVSGVGPQLRSPNARVAPAAAPRLNS